MKIIVTKYQNSDVYLPFVGEGAEINNAMFSAVFSAFNSGVLMTVEGEAIAASPADIHKLLETSGVTKGLVTAAQERFERATSVKDEVPADEPQQPEMTEDEAKAREKRISARLKALDKVKKDA